MVSACGLIQTFLFTVAARIEQKQPFDIKFCLVATLLQLLQLPILNFGLIILQILPEYSLAWCCCFFNNTEIVFGA